MKTTILSLYVLFLTVTLLADEPATSRFIREEGSYQLTEKTTLKLSSDKSGVMHYRYEHKLDKDSVGSHAGALETPNGGPFILYWDSPTKTLWGATAKLLLKISNEGATSYGGLALGDVKAAPDVFQREVLRIFRIDP